MKIDFTQPTLKQLWEKSYSKQNYLDFIHSSHAPTVRFFQSDLMERSTQTKWYVVPIVWIPYLLYWIVEAHNISPTVTEPITTGILSFALGTVIIWPIIEYVMHRFLFHMDDWLPPNNFFYILHFLGHGFHHISPNDHLRLVLPPLFFYPLFQLVRWGFIWPIFSAWPFVESLILAGGLFGYVMYDMTHYALHHFRSNHWLFQRLKRAHMYHHFQNAHSHFGVTNGVVDYLVGTNE